MKITDLTVDELQILIRKAVHEELQNIIADPDRGLELTEEIQTRLQSSLSSSERITLEEVKNRLSLT